MSVRPDIVSARRLHQYTYDAYLEHESSSNVKHEYLDGEIYAMAGGTLEHAALAMNVGAALVGALRGKPSIVASSDLKVRVEATGLATYPDVTVLCGEPKRDAKSRDVLLNPTLVVEVTSDSTEAWDRGEKLEHYRQIPSLKEHVLVSHRTRRIEVLRRGEDGSWLAIAAGPGEILELTSVGCSLDVTDVYRNVEVMQARE